MFIDVLRLYSTLLNNDIRLVIVRALILMRNRGLIECLALCELFFLRLLQCQDRLLRVTIQTHIVNDIKKQNDRHKNHKLNSVRSRPSFPRLATLPLSLPLDLTELHVHHRQRRQCHRREDGLGECDTRAPLPMASE